MQIIGRSVGAALAMGNACVLKPAEEACLTALAFARIVEHAGLPAGALNVVPGPRRGGRRGARGASRRASTLVHRLGRDGRAGPGRGGEERGAGDARAGRQVPADRLRRRRPRRRAALPRQRRHPERRPDLLGGVAHPRRARRVRRRWSRAWPSATARCASARRSPTSTSGPVISARQRDDRDRLPGAARDSGLRSRGAGRVAADAARRRLYVPPTLLADVPDAPRSRRRRSSARCRR